MLGPQRKILALAMYISFFWVSISFALGPVFQWNMSFTYRGDNEMAGPDTGFRE